MEIRSNFTVGTGNTAFPASKPALNQTTAKPAGSAGGDLFSKISPDMLKNQMTQLRDLNNNVKVGGGCGSSPKPPSTGGGCGSAPKPKPSTGGGCGSAPKPKPSTGGGCGSAPAPKPKPKPSTGGGCGSAPKPKPSTGGGCGSAPAPKPKPKPSTGGAVAAAHLNPSLQRAAVAE